MAYAVIVTQYPEDRLFLFNLEPKLEDLRYFYEQIYGKPIHDEEKASDQTIREYTRVLTVEQTYTHRSPSNG